MAVNSNDGGDVLQLRRQIEHLTDELHSLRSNLSASSTTFRPLHPSIPPPLPPRTRKTVYRIAGKYIYTGCYRSSTAETTKNIRFIDATKIATTTTIHTCTITTTIIIIVSWHQIKSSITTEGSRSTTALLSTMQHTDVVNQ
jgi:hypothetical protein